MKPLGGTERTARHRFRAGLARAVAELGGDRAAELASGVNKSIWYDAKTGRSIPDERTSWPAMRILLSSLAPARTGVRDWDGLYAAVGVEVGRRRRPATATPPVAPQERRPVPRQLPLASTVFTGRDTELATLDRLLLNAGLTTPAMAVVAGAPGTGKTGLALHWAHRTASAFPDGVLYVDLRGWGTSEPLPPEMVLPGWLRAFGVEPGESPADHGAMLRTVLDGLRVLILLDNARSEEQIRPLLPGSPSCAVLVTSRHELPGLAVQHGAEVLALGLLPPAESLLLLQTVLGERVEQEPAAARDMTRLSGRLPLALRIVAEHARRRPTRTLTSLVDTLAGEANPLDSLDSEDPRSDPRTVFSWSYRQLTDEVARTFRMFSQHPGDLIGPHAVAALTGSTTRQAARRLQVLTRAHLVVESGPARYSMHDLLRRYAEELVYQHDDPASVDSARLALMRYYLHAVRRAETVIEPHRYRPVLPPGPDIGDPAHVADRAAALAWLDAECANVVALCQQDLPVLDSLRWRLAFEIRAYFFLTKRTSEWVASHEAALAATIRAEDRHGEAMTRSNLGLARHEQGDDDGALREYQHAHRCFLAVDDLHGVSNTLAHQAAIYRRRSDFETSLELGGRALAFYRRANQRRNVAITLRGLAVAEVETGRHDDAERHLAECLVICAQLGMVMDAARAQHTLGRLLLLDGRLAESAAAFRAAARYSEQCGSRFERALALRGLGQVAALSGDVGQARAWWQESLSALRILGSAKADEVASELAALPQQLTPIQPEDHRSTRG
ncbi:tetratricopeptide repeat protein [Micromonospora sp. HUAS LYJ1]|uniref:ATP-binding protein n=1 Tax=Micromonospora sp. HUAS LYJ1 TaxID=3061626 RepID=UPI00267223A4|nr:tetratricopeptide repeat protein [Micromonospora sp. HUAS LYJ1]WKU04962.1 tetratricopeptide repeat protein [Micromonospora sp. HUAS LYJ1]